MKKVIILLALVFAGATLQQCSDEQDHANLSTSEVSFDINLASDDATSDLKPVSNLSIVGLVLERPNGTVALQRELKIYSQNNLISTESVELEQGEYRIREFTARDADRIVVYQLQINHATTCEGDKNLLKTFYSSGKGSKSISLVLNSVARSQVGS